MDTGAGAVCSHDPAVLLWQTPAAASGGDVIATARAPGGALLHVMLADSAGGAAAALLLAPFQRMTEKGYAIDAIARELNATVRRDPGRRFIAALLVAVDFGEGVVRVWNGGGPAPVLVCAADALAGPAAMPSRAFARAHVPLGVRPDADLDTGLDIHAFADGGQLLLCSDGLTEAVDAAGVRFGQARFVRTVEQAPAADRLAALQAAISAHLGGQPGHDDISVLLVECRRLEVAQRPAGTVAVPTAAAVAWQATLRLTAEEIRRVDAVPVLLGIVRPFDHAKADTDRLFVVLSELYNNAVDHGLLQMDSALKLAPEGMESYLAERQARLAALTEGEIELRLEQVAGPGGRWLRVVCRDSGPGFAYAAMAAATPATAGELPFGRGLMLLRAICPVLDFNPAGNEATAMIALDAAG